MTLWYLARATGFAAFLAFTAATVLGTVGSAGGLRLGRGARAGRGGRDTDPGAAVDRRFVLHMLHRSAAITGLALLAVHVGTIVVDSYVDVTLTTALIPLTGPYKTVPVAVGTLALWLTVTVAATGALRGRITGSGVLVRRWRAVHLAAYGAWGLMVLHGLLAGTDQGTTWARALFVAGALLVAFAAVWRLAAERGRRRSAEALVRPARAGAHPSSRRTR